MKGCSKPAGFKLGRAQMIPDGNLVFDYVTDVSKAGKGSFFNYIDKTALRGGTYVPKMSMLNHVLS